MMRRLLLNSFCLLLYVLFTCSFSGCAVAPTVKIKNEMQLHGLHYGILNNLVNVASFDKAIASGVYLFVKIGASWCGPCKSLEPIIRQLALEQKDVLFIEINFDAFKTVAQRYGIKSIPAVLLFNDGKIVSKTVGNKPKSYWESLIKSSFGL